MDRRITLVKDNLWAPKLHPPPPSCFPRRSGLYPHQRCPPQPRCPRRRRLRPRPPRHRTSLFGRRRTTQQRCSKDHSVNSCSSGNYLSLLLQHTEESRAYSKPLLSTLLDWQANSLPSFHLFTEMLKVRTKHTQSHHYSLSFSKDPRIQNRNNGCHITCTISRVQLFFGI